MYGCADFDAFEEHGSSELLISRDRWEKEEHWVGVGGTRFDYQCSEDGIMGAVCSEWTIESLYHALHTSQTILRHAPHASLLGLLTWSLIAVRDSCEFTIIRCVSDSL